MKNYFIVVTLLLTVVMAGCGQTSTETNTQTDTAKESIKIGFIAPLSGDQATVGSHSLRGAQIAVDEINAGGGIDGAPVTLIAEDDQWDENQTISAYNKLVQTQDVSALLTLTYGGFFGLAERASEDGVIVVNPLDASEELAGIGPNMFSIGIYDESIGYAIADHLTKTECKNAGALFVQDPLTQLIENAVKQRFAGTLNVEHYTFDTRDYRTALLKVKKSDCLVIVGFDESGRIVKQARELAIHLPIVGFDTFAAEGFRTNVGGDLDGLHFTFWTGAEDNEQYQSILAKYQERHGEEPENVLFFATGYDAARILLESMKGCAGKTACVRGNLRSVKEYPGATGLVTMDEDQITRSIRETIYRYDGEEIVPAS